MNILSLSPNTAMLLATVLLASVAVGSWARPRRPLWATIVVHIGTFAVLTWLVKTGLGSPLRPQFETQRSGIMLWQQCIEVGWWIIGARAVAAAIRAMVALEGRPHESRIVSDLMAAGIYVATGLAIINFAFAVPVGGLLATSGVIAIVLGLALQSTLSDVFSGIAVGLERAYKPGDLLWVEGDIEGTVVQISWRSTQIRTRHDNIAIIPNNVIAKSRLINRSSPTPQRADNLTIKLDSRADPDRCVTILNAALQTCLLPLATPKPYVAYTGLTGDGGTYEIGYSVRTSNELTAAKTELLSQVHRHLFHARIALAVNGSASPPPVPPTTIETLMERSSMFGVLPAEEREAFARHFVPVTLDKGDTLIREGEMATAMFIICSGAVEVTCDDAGAHRVLARVGPGEVIGVIGLLTDKPHVATGTALTDVEAYRFDTTSLAAALNVCPNMAHALKELALRKEKILLQGIANPTHGKREHAQVFLWRIREALHRLAA